jgi:simple sugar transport system ATP-binding protein
MLGRQREPFCQTGGRLLAGSILRWAHGLLAAGEVVFSDIEEDLAALSGGNQQKVALTRVLDGKPRLVILEQPGRGLDIRARERLHQRVRDLSSEGITFLLFSHDLEELMSLSRRLAVLYRGKVMGIVDRDQASREMLAGWMVGLEGGR